MSTQKILKNTLYLFLRMVLNMVISLFTVRIVFNSLGSVDYGLYNVIAGVTIFFTFIGTTLSSASQRYFSYEIGMNNYDRLNKIFNLSIYTYIIFSVVILFLFESVGIWFVNNKLNYPIDRISSVNILFQFSIFTFLFNFFTIPFNAMIIAKEKMNFYAKISIYESIVKLLVASLLLYYKGDKLIFYSFLLFIVAVINFIIYFLFTKIKFREIKFIWYWNSIDAKSLISYSGWNLFGSITSVLNNQGINILINQFFGPSINASRAISYQVNGSISSITSNLYLAFSPQIVKSFAEGDIKNLQNLVFKGTKFGYILLLIVTIPVYIKIQYILTLWLGASNVNITMIRFTRLILIYTLINSFESPITYAVRATGKIKIYQISVGIFTLLTLPISYLFFKLGYNAEVSVVIMGVIYFFVMFIRIYVLKKLIPLFNVLKYLFNVYIKLIIIGFLIFIITNRFSMNIKGDFITQIICVSFFNLFIVIIFSLLFILERGERKVLSDRIMKKISKK